MQCAHLYRENNVLLFYMEGYECPLHWCGRSENLPKQSAEQDLHFLGFPVATAAALNKKFQDQTANQLQKFTFVGYGLGFSQRFKHLGAGIELIKPLPFYSNSQLGWNPHPWHSRPMTLVPYLFIKSHWHTSGSGTSPNAHFRKLLMAVTNTSS